MRNEPHYAKVYCVGPHPSGRRRWVAVLTKENPPRLVTDAEDVLYVDGGEPFLVTPCDWCELDQGQRLLSVELFKQARADDQAEISLDDVLWQRDTDEVLGKGQISS